jgi:hypothetical protein
MPQQVTIGNKATWAFGEKGLGMSETIEKEHSPRDDWRLIVAAVTVGIVCHVLVLVAGGIGEAQGASRYFTEADARVLLLRSPSGAHIWSPEPYDIRQWLTVLKWTALGIVVILIAVRVRAWEHSRAEAVPIQHFRFELYPFLYTVGMWLCLWMFVWLIMLLYDMGTVFLVLFFILLSSVLVGRAYGRARGGEDGV